MVTLQEQMTMIQRNAQPQKDMVEFVFAARLSCSLSARQIETLRIMVGEQLDHHWHFGAPVSDLQDISWETMLTDSSSCFPGKQHASFDFKDGAFLLTVRSSFCCAHDEVRTFLYWIEPFLESYTGMLGYYKYYEQEYPILIMQKEQKFVLLDPVSFMREELSD